MKYLIGALVAALSLFSNSVVAQDRLVLEPTSDWVLDYADDSCALRRQFGEEGQQVYFEFRQFGPDLAASSNSQFIVASPDFRLARSEPEFGISPLSDEPSEMMSFDINLGDGYEGKLFAGSLFVQTDDYLEQIDNFIRGLSNLSENQKVLLLRANALLREGSEGQRELGRLLRDEGFIEANSLIRTALEDASFVERFGRSQESEIEGLTFDEAFSEDLQLQTGSMKAPMEAMRTCLEELQSHWGIDVEAHHSLTRKARPVDMENWARSIQQQYPSQMVRRGMPGYLRTRLDISADGRVTGCHMQNDISNEDFVEKACGMLTRLGRFEPALDAQGQPIASYYQIAVIYRLS